MSALLRLGPWLAFLVGGTIAALVIHSSVPRRDTLVLDGGRVTMAIQRESDLRGRPLAEAESAAVIAELKDEEILLADARRRNHLARGAVYGRLIKKMRSLLAEDQLVPSDAELKAVYDKNPESFQREGAGASGRIPFAEALPHLRGAWTMERQRAVVLRRTRELLSRYRVFVEDGE